jgi:hypothetical protein
MLLVDPMRASPTSPAVTDGAVRWLRESRIPGNPVYRVGRTGDRLVADWEGIGVLSAPLPGFPGEASLEMAAGLDPAFVEKWREGTVRSLLRHRDGKTTLHGSAIRLGGRAIVFLGESGAGKSTCTAHLCKSLGAELLADDSVDIETAAGEHVVAPTQRAHWLRRDSAEALGHAPMARWKTSVDAPRAAAAPAVLGALVRLAFGADGSPPELARLEGALAFTAVNASFVRFVFDDPAVETRDLDAIANLVAAAPVFTLTRPRSFAMLGASAALVAELAASAGSSARR